MKTDYSLLYFWLGISGVPRKRVRQLIELAGTVESLFEGIVAKKSILVSAADRYYAGLAHFAQEDILRDRYNELTKRGIEMVTPHDNVYPDSLKNIDDAPLLLYCKGNVNLFNTPAVAIVGTRECTEYGAKCAKLFGAALAEAGVTVVSGLAGGIDTVAHRAALDVKGNTIAVLGSGFDHIYPASNFGLYKNIVDNGLVVTEYPPETTPAKYTFPERNRIVSGMSRGVLVVEGGEKSGSLITAQLALEQNKELFAVPGRIDSPYSKGVNRLIKSAQCSLVLEPDDILSELKLGTTRKTASQNIDNIQLDVCEGMVYNILVKNGMMHFGEILQESKLDIVTLNTVLFGLEEKKLVTKHFGNKYST